jgi:Common central domain of tyrosinase
VRRDLTSFKRCSFVLLYQSDLSSAAEQLTTKTYNLLSRVSTWPAFSNHTPDDGGSSSNSLEAIHDEVHVVVGGSGHMGDPAVAGRLLYVGGFLSNVLLE